MQKYSVLSTLHVTPLAKIENQFSLSLKAKQLAKQEIEKFISLDSHEDADDIDEMALEEAILRNYPYDIAKSQPTVLIDKKSKPAHECFPNYSSDSSSSSNISCCAGSTSSDSGDEPCPPPIKKRAILTTSLAAALDRALISDRKATAVIQSSVSPIESSLGVNMTLSRSSIRRLRVTSREGIAANVKKNFKPTVGLTVHWDGKKVRDYHGDELLDRLPILVSGHGVSKLLSAPALKHGTGLAQATAVHSNLLEWNVAEKTVAMCTDTEAANTGKFMGAVKQLETLLDRELLYFACRHHVFEIPLEAVVTKSLGTFSSPEVPLFKQFKNDWKNFDKTRYVVGTADSSVRRSLSDKDRTVQFLLNQLQEFQPRDDYRELAELLFLFAGEVPEDGAKFRRPGSISRTRWMMYAIYALKIFLFRTQFTLTPEQKKGIEQICLYAFNVHAVHWFTAPAATMAPRMDLLFIRKLEAIVQARSKLSDVAGVALLKFQNHLWYLSEHMVSLSFFDPEVTVAEKREMVVALRNASSKENVRRRLPKSVTKQSTLANFVSHKSLFFFDQYGINRSFLEKDPSTWEEDEDFMRGMETSKHILVVNDIAERGVKLVTSYINTLTKSEEGFQNLLQVVELHQKLCPKLTKHEIKAVPLLL
ncbi:Kynurenine 3-monooxygenase [Frankliniella fusca]|uniref:Kynurenine 3-monooxygenase n=1 Tax=Frankliniella fusca TaxID=407009 RepID=A0AAE1I1W4_9NEOP|nr:Kynurenine 3-monooxygenase [Frankliniella fusca]KAK3931764.1 Kynurenine 3-monooxygenase [Frankliniella fusca]